MEIGGRRLKAAWEATPMRLKDAYSWPSAHFRFQMDTRRALLKNFVPGEPTPSEVEFVRRALTPALRFITEAGLDSELPSRVIELLRELRPIVRNFDYGIGSYSL